MTLPARVKIVEVGPRDGLQNEAASVPVEVKAELIEMLVAAGLPVVEAGAFVSPQWVPQMADSDQVFRLITKQTGVSYPMLVPNLKGLEVALEAGVQEIALFAAASETFSSKNTNCSIAESIERFNLVIDRAQEANLKIRGYISCALGCPYEGDVSFDLVAKIAERLYQAGCYEISLADTIGVGTASDAVKMVETVAERVPVAKLAAHFHDTYGQALTNVHAVMQVGIAVVDSSIAGLGGCPYAKGASGNLATEDLVYMLDGMGIESGVDINQLLAAGRYINHFLARQTVSRAGLALSRKQGC